MHLYAIFLFSLMKFILLPVLSHVNTIAISPLSVQLSQFTVICQHEYFLLSSLLCSGFLLSWVRHAVERRELEWREGFLESLFCSYPSDFFKFTSIHLHDHSRLYSTLSSGFLTVFLGVEASLKHSCWWIKVN